MATIHSVREVGPRSLTMAADLQPTVRLFLRIFSAFGLVQVRYGPDNQLAVVKRSAYIIPILLLIYWINAVVVFCYERPSTDTISLVSNVIQMALNSILISVAVIIPIQYMDLARRTILQMQSLVADLASLQISVDFRKVCRDFCLILFFFFSILIYSISYDAYATYQYGMMTVKYWFFSILPPVYMVLVLTQAICTLALTNRFYKCVNKVILAQIPRTEADEIEPMDTSINKIQPAEKFAGYRYPEMDSRAVFFPKMCEVLGSLNEICQKLETYFGPLFLISFTTIFVVTSIQLYYCYQIITQVKDEARGYSYWTMVISVNVVLTNVILVIATTALCQAITNQVSRNCLLLI